MAAPTPLLNHPRRVETSRGTPNAPGPFLVATDGTRESDDAIVLARALAADAHAQLHAISICEEALPPAQMPFMNSPVYSVGDPAFVRANRRMRIGDQFLRVLGPGHRARIVVRCGSIGAGIAAYATENACELVIAGRGRHSIMERILGEEHMLRLLRATSCPVLMAEPGLRTPPRRAVIGLDFSERDHAAAAAAISIIAPDAKVFLVHVKPDFPFGAPVSGSWLPTYTDAMRTGLEELQTQLPLAPTHKVERVILTGHAGKCLADFAHRADADLIAVGTHGLGFIHRFVIGSTAAYLLRSAKCSVLVATPKRDEDPRAA